VTGQNFINSGSDLGNNSDPPGSAGGIATVDLRGIGPQRNLVLADGKRLGNGDPNTSIRIPRPTSTGSRRS
jgi:outer membrane receptor for ferrienterochelin and colicin